jgi:hypothetical protein
MGEANGAVLPVRKDEDDEDLNQQRPERLHPLKQYSAFRHGWICPRRYRTEKVTAKDGVPLTIPAEGAMW